jgi:hypothetical protein
MMDIPDELINKIAHDDAVLFVGAGLSQGAGLPGWRALLEPLADSIRLPDSQRIDLLKIAWYYERERGRQALLDHIFEQTDTIGKEPTENHHRLYRLGLRTWVTTNYDNLIERTFIELRGQFIKIVRDLNLSYTRTDRVTLVKLHGDREQPDTIVITEWDFNTYFRRDPRIRDKLISLLLEKTFLFVGYSHNDPDFRRILDEIAYDLREHQRRAYAMLFDADKFNISDLSSRNIHVLNIDMESQRNYSQRLGELLDELLRRAGKLPLARDTKSVEPSRSNLPHRLAFPPTAMNDSTAVEAHTFIAGLHNEIVLAQYCIVGSYIRYDDRVRDTLKEVRRMITTG